VISLRSLLNSLMVIADVSFSCLARLSPYRGSDLVLDAINDLRRCFST